MFRSIAGLALCASLGLAPVLTAQEAAPYPNINKVVVLAPGDTILLLNRVVVQPGPAVRPAGRRLDFQYSTRISASDGEARVAQADRAAETLGPQAVDLGIRLLSIGICDTRACAERRDPPGAWYLYTFTSRGWTRSP